LSFPRRRESIPPIAERDGNPQSTDLDVGVHARYNQTMRAKPKQRTRKACTERPDALQEAIDAGIDIAAIRDNLARTPAERLRRHQIALDSVRRLRKARVL
jgi:hypothetical protein